MVFAFPPISTAVEPGSPQFSLFILHPVHSKEEFWACSRGICIHYACSNVSLASLNSFSCKFHFISVSKYENTHEEQRRKRIEEFLDVCLYLINKFTRQLWSLFLCLISVFGDLVKLCFGFLPFYCCRIVKAPPLRIPII